MPAAYYIWKWADNDVSGKPSQIVARLCSGETPVAIESFPAEKVLRRLQKVADQRRTEMSELFIEPEKNCVEEIPFIHVSDPASDSNWLADKLLWAVWPSDLTLYDETNNRLLGLPKRNVVECPADNRQLVDIEPSDLPELLYTLSSRWHLSAVACYDRNGNMFQVWSSRHRFAVEWQILRERDFNKHRIWVAGKLPAGRCHARLGSPSEGLDLFSHEVLHIADAHRIWMAFLSGAEPPTNYIWRDITHELNRRGNVPRHKHQHKETQPPP